MYYMFELTVKLSESIDIVYSTCLDWLNSRYARVDIRTPCALKASRAIMRERISNPVNIFDIAIILESDHLGTRMTINMTPYTTLITKAEPSSLVDLSYYYLLNELLSKFNLDPSKIIPTKKLIELSNSLISNYDFNIKFYFVLLIIQVMIYYVYNYYRGSEMYSILITIILTFWPLTNNFYNKYFVNKALKVIKNIHN